MLSVTSKNLKTVKQKKKTVRKVKWLTLVVAESVRAVQVICADYDTITRTEANRQN